MPKAQASKRLNALKEAAFLDGMRRFDLFEKKADARWSALKAKVTSQTMFRSSECK